MPLMFIGPALARAHPLAGCDPLRLSEAQYLEWLRVVPDNRGFWRALGGTDVGPVLGLSKYQSGQDVWDKLMEQREQPDSANLRRGKLMEPVIATEYEVETRRTLFLYDEPLYGKAGEAQLRGSPDRGVREPVGAALLTAECRIGGNGVLEIKCQQAHMLRETKTMGLDPAYYAQLQHYLGMSGLRWGSVAAFNPEAWELHWFDVERDQAFIDEMYEECDRWWRAHILTRQRPGAQSETAVPAVRAPRVGAREVRLETPDWRRFAEQARAAKAMKDEAEHLYEQVRTDIKAAMEALGHECVRAPGMKASYPESTKRSFQKAALQRSAPLDRVKFLERFVDVVLEHTSGSWDDAIRPETITEELAEAATDLVRSCGVDFSEYENVTAARVLTLTFE